MDGDSPCADCGTEKNPVWFTESVFWNEVMKEERGKILCLYCFILRSESLFKITGWRVLPEWKWTPLPTKEN